MDEATSGQRKALAEIRREVGRLQQDIYADPHQAFCHYAIALLFDLDADDALEACAVGTTAGPSAMWHDDDQGRIVIVKARFAARSPRTFDRDDVRRAEKAYEIASKDPDQISAENGELLQEATVLHELRDRDPRYPIEIYCVVNGSFTAAARKQASAFNQRMEANGITLTLFELSDLAIAESERRSREAGPLETKIELDLERFFEFRSGDGTPRTIVASVDGAELAAIERRHQYRIFQRNVRYYLKQTQKVNRTMSRTLADPVGRQNFWYYNNGIAIVCDRYELKAHGPRARIAIDNLQIVNGCQTTTTLGANLGQLQRDDSRAHVLVRIIESQDDDLQRDITLYNNRQTAVRDRDLLSNDRTQDRLQLEFAEFGDGWFYERKRGEWEARVSADPALKKRFDRRLVNNEVAAQAHYAFFVNPAEARARKRMLFVPATDSGFYEQIFNDRTSPEELLLPYLLMEFIARRKREYQREVKAIDPEEADVEDLRLLARNWIKFADQYILGTMAFYIEKRMRQSRSAMRKLIESDFEALAETLYNLAIRDLSKYFRNKESQARQRQQPFSAANLVKGNWRDALAYLEDEWAWREAEDEDPFARFPMLTQGG